MFHAVTWDTKPKELPAKPATVLTRGSEFGLVQRPGTARFHNASARLTTAFRALRVGLPEQFRAEKGQAAPNLLAIFEDKLGKINNAGQIKEMPLKLHGRHEGTVKIFEEIWFNEQARTDSKVLITLDMNWLQIGPHGMERLVSAVLESNCNKSLTQLMLGHNFIRDEGCKHLKRLLEKNLTITSLQLDNNGIFEEGATCLGDALRSNRTLKTMELSRNFVGHEGLRAILDGMKESDCPRALNLSDNGFLPESFAMLSKGLVMMMILIVKNEVPLKRFRPECQRLHLGIAHGVRKRCATHAAELAEKRRQHTRMYTYRHVCKHSYV